MFKEILNVKKFQFKNSFDQISPAVIVEIPIRK